ncbi:MAG: hypothetical protein KJO07_18445, partial [Deltaproteobacteria bacterium]|nr:hypothetical protein [Deltaproteobacteria bacterium]
MSRVRLIAVTSLSALLALGACSGDPLEPVDDWGKPTAGSSGWSDSEGKADGLSGNPGLPTSVDSANTSVWEVRNQWHDTSTVEASQAGLAWSANSGLNWDEKYRAWVDSLERIDCDDCFGDTFALTTPYGKTLPAPSLECAEMAMFMRVAFASWYGLPYFIEGRMDGQRVFFGHFGIRTFSGRWRNTPRYKSVYPDFSHLSDDVAAGLTAWPSSQKLRDRKLFGAFDDDQPQIGEDAHTGAYFDELFLNKRVGHFLMMHLVYFGSVNLADPANMYNLKPEASLPGDVVVKRYQQTGIGHTLLVKNRNDYPDADVDGELLPQFDLELASGSMPRRQPQWSSTTSSKSSVTADAAGGPEHGTFGGGMKRYRVARSVGGKWTNVVLPGDADNWVKSSNIDAMEGRTDEFEKMFVELSAEEKLEALLEGVEVERAWLRDHPSSCAARTRREETFEQIYELGHELDMTREEIDAEHRLFEDYVLAELVYNQSKTCCWNSTNRAMFDIIIAKALADEEAAGQCLQ